MLLQLHEAILQPEVYEQLEPWHYFANVDSENICLFGRWRSNEMFCYLYVQAEPLMKNFASKMVQGGNFVLTPNHLVPIDV